MSPKRASVTIWLSAPPVGAKASPRRTVCALAVAIVVTVAEIGAS